MFFYSFFALSPGFLQEQDFPGSNLITAGHIGKNWFLAKEIVPVWT
jgi:hypothetical protein